LPLLAAVDLKDGGNDYPAHFDRDALVPPQSPATELKIAGNQIILSGPVC
jgi:hypothetical protein